MNFFKGAKEEMKMILRATLRETFLVQTIFGNSGSKHDGTKIEVFSVLVK